MLEKRKYMVGKCFGYLLMFVVFSVVLYFLLKILDKLPANWNYFHVLLITASLIFIGKTIKYNLEKP